MLRPSYAPSCFSLRQGLPKLFSLVWNSLCRSGLGKSSAELYQTGKRPFFFSKLEAGNSKEKDFIFILAFWEELCCPSPMAEVKEFFTEPPPGKNVDRLSVITVESQEEISKSRKTA